MEMEQPADSSYRLQMDLQLARSKIAQLERSSDELISELGSHVDFLKVENQTLEETVLRQTNRYKALSNSHRQVLCTLTSSISEVESEEDEEGQRPFFSTHSFFDLLKDLRATELGLLQWEEFEWRRRYEEEALLYLLMRGLELMSQWINGDCPKLDSVPAYRTGRLAPSPVWGLYRSSTLSALDSFLSHSLSPSPSNTITSTGQGTLLSLRGPVGESRLMHSRWLSKANEESSMHLRFRQMQRTVNRLTTWAEEQLQMYHEELSTCDPNPLTDSATETSPQLQNASVQCDMGLAFGKHQGQQAPWAAPSDGPGMSSRTGLIDQDCERLHLERQVFRLQQEQLELQRLLKEADQRHHETAVILEHRLQQSDERCQKLEEEVLQLRAELARQSGRSSESFVPTFLRNTTPDRSRTVPATSATGASPRVVSWQDMRQSGSPNDLNSSLRSNSRGERTTQSRTPQTPLSPRVTHGGSKHPGAGLASRYDDPMRELAKSMQDLHQMESIARQTADGAQTQRMLREMKSTHQTLSGILERL
jgi:hypothetical protein